MQVGLTGPGSGIVLYASRTSKQCVVNVDLMKMLSPKFVLRITKRMSSSLTLCLMMLVIKNQLNHNLSSSCPTYVATSSLCPAGGSGAPAKDEGAVSVAVSRGTLRCSSGFCGGSCELQGELSGTQPTSRASVRSCPWNCQPPPGGWGRLSLGGVDPRPSPRHVL